MSRLEHYSDVQEERGRFECECGNERKRGAVACDRCMFLDGNSGSLLERIISELRGSNGMTIRDLASAITGRQIRWATRDARSVTRSLHRALKLLLESGRIHRFERQPELAEPRIVVRDCAGRVTTIRRARDGESGSIAGSNGGVAYVYALGGRARR